MINPYKDVDWGKARHVHSMSHMHGDRSCSSMVEDGYEHIAISNYWPSKPLAYQYELAENASYVPFPYVPKGISTSPNAEQHNMYNIVGNQKNGDFHINSLGSTFESGRAQEKPEQYKEPYGVSNTWQYAFDEILKKLVCADGGGITLNHPNWYSSQYPGNKLSWDQLIKFLDYDPRVLGVEFFNHSSDKENRGVGWALDVWDNLLLTGRRVWGFCVTDHPNDNERPYRGRNVLLIDNDKFLAEANDPEARKVGAECLRAYREGRFYGKLYNTDLMFSMLKCENNVLTVKTNGADTISVIVDGKSETFNASEITYTVPKSAIYVRAEARKSGKVVSNYSGEESTVTDAIFSNPFMLDPQEDPPVNPPIEPPTPSPDEPEVKRISFSKMMWY